MTLSGGTPLRRYDALQARDGDRAIGAPFVDGGLALLLCRHLAVVHALDEPASDLPPRLDFYDLDAVAYVAAVRAAIAGQRGTIDVYGVALDDARDLLLRLETYLRAVRAAGATDVDIVVAPFTLDAWFADAIRAVVALGFFRDPPPPTLDTLRRSLGHPGDLVPHDPDELNDALLRLDPARVLDIPIGKIIRIDERYAAFVRDIARLVRDVVTIDGVQEIWHDDRDYNEVELSFGGRPLRLLADYESRYFRDREILVDLNAALAQHGVAARLHRTELDLLILMTPRDARVLELALGMSLLAPA